MSNTGDLSLFRQDRERAVAAIARLRRAAEASSTRLLLRGQRVSASQWLQDLERRLSESEFYVVVLGEYKVGKSSFLNVLLRQSWVRESEGHQSPDGRLPVDVLPYTSCVTKIAHGDALRIRLAGSDGTPGQELSEEEYRQAATVQGHILELLADDKWRREIRMQAARGLGLDIEGDLSEDEVREWETRAQELEGKELEELWEQVYMECPAAWLREGVRVADTPGLGSVYYRHGLVAMRESARADAVVFLINTMPQVGERDLCALDRITSYVGRVFFVQTRIDLYQKPSKKDLRPRWQRALEYNQETLSEQFANVEIYPVSALWAAQALRDDDAQLLERSGLPAFEQALNSYLGRTAGPRLIVSQLARAEQVGQQAVAEMELERSRWAIPLGRLKQREEELKERLAVFEQTKAAAAGEARRVLGTVRDEAEQSLRREDQELAREITRRLPSMGAGAVTSWLSALVSRKDRRTLADRMRELCGDHIGRWNERLERCLQQRFRQIVSAANRRLMDEVERLQLDLPWPALDADQLLDEAISSDLGEAELGKAGLLVLASGAGAAALTVSLLHLGAVAEAALAAPVAALAVVIAAAFLKGPVESWITDRIERELQPAFDKMSAELASTLAGIQERVLGAINSRVGLYIDAVGRGISDVISEMAKEGTGPGARVAALDATLSESQQAIGEIAALRAELAGIGETAAHGQA